MPAISLPVSVIIPTYRREQLTAQALLSVCLQSAHPREVLIVDDGSGPSYSNLQKLCRPIARRFHTLNIHLTTLRRNLGMPGAVRNIGMLRASQPWLAFLDSDDVWLPQKLSEQWKCVQKSGAKIIHCRELWLRFGTAEKQTTGDIKNIDPRLAAFAPYSELLLPPQGKSSVHPLAAPQVVSQKKHKHPREGKPKLLWPAALKKCILGPSTLLLHRSVCNRAGYFDPHIQIAEDYEYFLRLISSFEVAYCPDYLVVKRDNLAPSQLSRRLPWIEPCRAHALEKLLLSPRATRLFSPEQHSGARAELLRKWNICLSGARKRRAKTPADLRISMEVQKLEAKVAWWQSR